MGAPGVTMDDPTAGPPADATRTGGPSDAGPGGTRPATSAPRERRWLVRVLIWGTTVLAVVAIFAVWANRQLLNPNNWANTSTKLLQNPKIREATSNYLVDQLYANVNVAEELKTGCRRSCSRSPRRWPGRCRTSL